SLNPKGFLWLGKSETIGTFRELFELEDPKHKVYSKKARAARPIGLPLGPHSMRLPDLGTRPTATRDSAFAAAAEAQKEADRILNARYVPPSVLVNGEFEILQFRGETGAYLAPAAGKASLNLVKMLREGLLVAVRGALLKARKEEKSVRETGLRVKSNGGGP